MKPGSTPFTRIAERCVVVRHHADQAVDTGFARAVRVLSRRQAVEAGWAGRTHHRPALRLEQSSHAVLAGQEGPGEIDVDDPAPHARVETVGAVIDLGGLDRGICHDDVEPAEASCGVGVAAAMSSSMLTSATSASALPPDAVMRETVRVAAASSMSTTATLAPSTAKRIAAAHPMPLPAPVINARLPPVSRRRLRWLGEQPRRGGDQALRVGVARDAREWSAPGPPRIRAPS